jgi:diguanylate cyclase (GGDEF)-like protein
MSRLKSWWVQPDQFDWVTKLLRQRGLLRSARVIMAIVGASSALAPLAVLTHPFRPMVVWLAIGIIGAAFCVGMIWFWLTRWPTRRQSEVAAVIGALCVASWSVAQPSPALAALGCTAMAITGGYIAFFHSAKLFAFNLVIAVAIAIAATIRLAGQTDFTTAAAAFWLIWLLNVAVPLTLRGTARAMEEYAARSDEDPLTGLLNRRGFIDAINAQLASPQPTATHLTVLMVDLDHFKVLNDTRGHAAGDRALLAVAELLRLHMPPTAAICRAGGEEFLVAVPSADSDSLPIATRLCAAIAGLAQSVTASIGTANAELHTFTGPQTADRIEQLISAADIAMYAAKRKGGNHVHHASSGAEF